jgi:predicted amidohydrolase
MDRIRVASLQYFIRPVTSYEQFRDQVTGLVETAADYKCQLLVFPEYFTVQLLTLGDTSGKVYNDCHFFTPEGQVFVQGKLHMTRFEKEEWFVSPRSDLKVFDTSIGKIAITICYDVEFPELARSAARLGATILVTPSCTDERQGLLRVRYCAQARAIENQMYVIQSSMVGSLPMVPAVSLNYGQAGIFTPSDFSFARDGILAEGIPNQETMVIGELNLNAIESLRKTGTVLPLRDSVDTDKVVTSLISAK